MTKMRKFNEDELVVFDTNVLLNLYFVEELDYLEVYFSEFKENIWTPYHVSEEFNRKRKTKVLEIKNRVDKLLEFKTKDIANNSLKEYKNMPIGIGENIRIKIYKYLDGIEEYIEYIKPELLKVRKEFGIYSYEHNDKYYEIIKNNIFLKTGEPYTDEELSTISNIARERFEKKIPPGYEDNEKNSNEYGDYIIWSQIIAKAKEEKKNVIFITNEEKKDWKVNGEWRPELIEEFYRETDKSISLMSLSEFIEYMTYKEYSDINDLLSNLSYLDNNIITKEPYREKFFYYECISDILNQRRNDYTYKNCSNYKAYLELIETRELIENRNSDIYCGGIKSPRYALSMDVYIRENNLMRILCTIHYKSDSELLISLEDQNGFNIVDTKGDYSKNYVKDIAKLIIKKANKGELTYDLE